MLMCLKVSGERQATSSGSTSYPSARNWFSQGCVHVNGVPEYDEIDDEPERAQLVLLAFAIALAEFATFAMESDVREPMPSFATVELHQDASAIAVIVDKAQQIKRLDEAAQLL